MTEYPSSFMSELTVLARFLLHREFYIMLIAELKSKIGKINGYMYMGWKYTRFLCKILKEINRSIVSLFVSMYYFLNK